MCISRVLRLNSYTKRRVCDILLQVQTTVRNPSYFLRIHPTLFRHLDAETNTPLASAPLAQLENGNRRKPNLTKTSTCSENISLTSETRERPKFRSTSHFR